MSRSYSFAAFGVALSLCVAARAQERSMGVTQKPDVVFSAPVESFLPDLAGATATDVNGRVGGELVFWGYELADGRPVFMFACAPTPTVICEERVQRICVDRTNVLRNATVGGDVTRRRCSTVSVALPGDPRPGCVQAAEVVDLAVGLVSCG
jgi:hypothetical protein